MGCGASSGNGALHELYSDTTLDEVETKMLQRPEAKPLRKQLDHGQTTYRTLQSFAAGDAVLSLWHDYLSVASETNNIFVGVEAKHPEVRALFPSIKLFNRHTSMVHRMLGSCILSVVHGNIIDMGLALHSLGCFHAQKGVTLAQLETLEDCCTKAILLACGKSVTNITPHQANCVIRDVVQVVVAFMLVGATRHEHVMAYVKLMVEKKDNCWQRRQMAYKCRMYMAKGSWKRLGQHLTRL